MASYNKFECFAGDLAGGVHDLNGDCTASPATADVLEVYLTNSAPSAADDSVKADLAEIATGNGYTGGVSCQNTGSEASGTFTLTGTKITITASGGAIAQFRYVVLFNEDAADDPLIGWWDYGSAVDLASGESFTIEFNGGDPTGTIFTLA